MKIVIILTLVFLANLGFVEPVSASSECYGYGASNREWPSATYIRYAQIYTPTVASDLVSVTMPVYSNSGAAGNFHFQIVETTGGVPNGSVVAGSVVQIPSNSAPDFSVGSGQSFVCGSERANQTFTFASPINLSVGTIYAFSIHQTGTGNPGTISSVTGFPSIVPTLGYKCDGVLAGHCNLSEWALTEFPGGSGINFDIVYSVENELIDPTSADGKVDGWIQQLREYLRLADPDGGMLFSIGVVGIVFIVGLMNHIPFAIMALINTILVGIFARAGIMPPWILIAVVAVAGFAIVMKIANTGSGGNSSEI